MGRVRKVTPVSVALDRDHRDLFEAEARRRGLGISTTIRTLAIERVRELRSAEQRERALRWQTERVLALADRIEKEGIQEVDQAEIGAVFDRPRTASRGRSRSS